MPSTYDSTGKPDPEGFKLLLAKRTELRKLGKHLELPHLVIEERHNPEGNNPLLELSCMFETLVNALLVNYATSGDEKLTSMLSFLDDVLHNVSQLCASIMIEDLKYKAMRLGEKDGKDMLKKVLGDGWVELFTGDDVEDRGFSVPQAFMDAFKEEEDDDASR